MAKQYCIETSSNRPVPSGALGKILKSKLRVGVLDLAARAPTKKMFSRLMRANLASIMPQIIAVWAEEAGHDVHFVCYTGVEDLASELDADLDILFISAFTRSAHIAYALSNMCQAKGCVTVLGGPHARCYPDDALNYFDYVLGITDRSLIEDVLNDCTQHRPIGVALAAAQQPTHLPGVQQRWKFISATLDKTPTRIKFVPMIGSLGCPYRCSFCIDSKVDYQPLEYQQISSDLKFLQTKLAKPTIAWHDPNFGVRFDDYLSLIEEASPKGNLSFVAESSLSLLGEPNAKRLGEAGCIAILPGIESWFDMGNKSSTGQRQGEQKVLEVSEQVNMILRHIPYLQANFVLGLDTDVGAAPFELTKKFIELTPGAFPAYSLLSAFGEAVPQNIGLQRDGRILGFPFYFLDNNKSMNVRPLNYEWPEFYDHLIDLMQYSFSPRALVRRFGATKGGLSKFMNLVRAGSSEGYYRLQYHKRLRARMDSDPGLLSYLNQETETLPAFYTDTIKRSLGEFHQFLPAGGMVHDQNAYLKNTEREAGIEVSLDKIAVHEQHHSLLCGMPSSLLAG